MISMVKKVSRGFIIIFDLLFVFGGILFIKFWNGENGFEKEMMVG